MFGRRENGSIDQVEAQIEPYRNVVVAYETDRRLQSLEVELIGLGKHVLTSNDRYQFSAAYLMLTRNHAMVTDAIVDSMTQSSDDDLKADDFAYNKTADFLLRNYQSTSDGLEEADRIAAIKGFNAGADEVTKLQSFFDNYDWLQSSEISRSFLAGTVNGLRSVNVNIHNAYSAMIKSKQLQNMMRMQLQQHTNPLIATVNSKLEAIDRITNSNMATVKSEKVMDDLYQDVIHALRVTDELAIWLTLPKLYDGSFTLRNPLDELRTPSKSFVASALGEVATKRAAAPPPATQSKSFDASTLNTTPAKSGSSKPFNPDTLNPTGGSTSSGQPKSGKSFKPDDLK